MPLGYMLTLREVLGYYGEERPEVGRAIVRAAWGRPVRLADWTEPDGEKGPALPEGEPLPEFIRRTLLSPPGDYGLDDVPPRYPALHSRVERDIVLEVDAKESQRTAFEGGRRILDFLTRYQAPFRVKFSGNSSPHVIIPQRAYEWLVPEEKRNAAFSDLFGWLTKQLSDKVPGWFDSSFGQSAHGLRLPYSLNERTGLVSLPIRPEAFDAFEPGMAEVPNVRVEEWWFETDDLLARQEGMRRLLREALGHEIA